jgi:FixJ family two-component response regulator
MIVLDHVVFVVDDDFRVREALDELLTSAGLSVVTFATAAEYMAFAKPELPACLVLDLELPDINGLELQAQIAPEHRPQIVFLTGHGDVPSSVRALKAGAVDFLTKPFGEADLLAAIHTAIAKDRDARLKRAELASLQQRFAALTRRERDVLPLVVSGLLNKQAAAALGISEVTLQIHRGRVMHKMGAGSLAELVRMAGALGIQ